MKSGMDSPRKMKSINLFCAFFAKLLFTHLFVSVFLIICATVFVSCSSNDTDINSIVIENADSNKVDFVFFDNDYSSGNLNIKGSIITLGGRDRIFHDFKNNCNQPNKYDMILNYSSEKADIIRDVSLCGVKSIQLGSSCLYVDNSCIDLDKEKGICGNFEDKLKSYIRCAVIQKLNLSFYKYYLFCDTRVFDPRVDILNFRSGRDNEGLVFTGIARVSFAERKRVLPVPFISGCNGCMVCWVDIVTLMPVKFELKLVGNVN